MDINNYVLQASEPCNVIFAQPGAESALHIKIEPVVSILRGKEYAPHKVARTNVMWTVRWADTVKGGWNNFGVVSGKHIVKAVKRICKMHATQ